MKRKDVESLEDGMAEESISCRNTGTIEQEVPVSIQTMQLLENNEMKWCRGEPCVPGGKPLHTVLQMELEETASGRTHGRLQLSGKQERRTVH